MAVLHLRFLIPQFRPKFGFFGFFGFPRHFLVFNVCVVSRCTLAVGREASRDVSETSHQGGAPDDSTRRLGNQDTKRHALGDPD